MARGLMPMQDLLDLQELQDSARQVLVRARERGTPQPEVWNTLVDLGWLGVSLPQENGGLDQPFTALATLYQEFGRALAPHDFVAVSICLGALAGAAWGGNAWVGGAAGKLNEQTLAGAATPMYTTATARDVRAVAGRLCGVIRNVLGAGDASHLLLPFDDSGPVVGLVALPHPGVSCILRPTWDSTRRLFDVVLEDVVLQPENIVCQGAAAVSVLKSMGAQIDLAVACDAVGGAEAIFGETLAYMQTRHQFGRPIASFQALKHRCADLATDMCGSRALLTAGCEAVAALQGDWASAAACGRLYASEVYRKVTEEAVQLHGGVGFTWEHSCHRFLKRARLNDALGGTPEQRKDALAPELFRQAALGRPVGRDPS
jgi:alkylation response protein AidB-like acyl-CoA dehydrogenase